MTGAPTQFDQLVLSGGGTRCFWQGGFLHRVEDEIGLPPDRIAAVSGGVLAACGHVAHVGEEVYRTTVEMFENLEHNIDLDSDEGGPSPHEEAYEAIIERCFDQDAIDRIRNGPRLEVLLTKLPDHVWNGVSVAASFTAYLLERVVRGSPDKALTRLAGIEELRVDANDAAASGELKRLICTAARLPPAFAVDRWRGNPVIDGGSISDAPFPSEDRGESLALLTSQFRDLPKAEGRHFVMPSKTVPTDKIDFTDPQEIRDAWNLGVEDGERFLERWRQGPLDWNEPMMPS